MKGLDCIMKKRILMATLSMALVVGLAGIVNASTMGSNTTDTPSQAPNSSAYVTHNNVSSMRAVQGATSQTAQTQPSQPDQTSSIQTDINTPMKSSNVSMNHQIQNMPVNTQMQTMPMSTPMNGPMSNSQNRQGMSGTNRPNQANASSATQQSGQKSSGITMMGSTGKMGR